MGLFSKCDLPDFFGCKPQRLAAKIINCSFQDGYMFHVEQRQIKKAKVKLYGPMAADYSHASAKPAELYPSMLKLR